MLLVYLKAKEGEARGETLYTRWMPQLTREQIKAFALYQDMLQDWNSRMNLTAITQPEEVASKHFADSVLPAALLPPGAKVIDVGTGAGFPGLPFGSCGRTSS